MKTNFAKLRGMVEPLKSLVEKEMTISFSYKLYQVIEEINPQLEIYERLEKKIVDKYKAEEKDESGNGTGNVIIPQDKVEEYRKDMVELMETEVEVNIPTVSPEEFIREEIKIAPTVFLSLSPLFKK